MFFGILHCIFLERVMTPEDEAFDELAKRQGAWGGGFKAKQGMAMHKTQDQNICRHYKQWQHCHICDLESQVAELASIKAILDEYGLQAIDFVADFKAALAQPAQKPINLLEARKIAAEYGTPDLQIDSGNLYFALSKCLEHIDAQPAQEPVAYVTGMSFGRFIVEPLNPAMVLPVGMALYSLPLGKK